MKPILDWLTEIEDEGIRAEAVCNYYYTFRGNGYGAFSTAQDAKSDFKSRASLPKNRGYDTAHIFKGIANVDKDKILQDTSMLKLIDVFTV